MTIEILTDPNRPENRRGSSSRRLAQRARQGLSHWQLGLLGLAGGLVLLGLIQQMNTEPERAEAADSHDPGQPQPHEPEWLPQHLQALEPEEFGRMSWRDDPDSLYDSVRPVAIVERNASSRSLRVALRQEHADGLWRIHSVRQGQEIPGTGLRVARIDRHIAFARDDAQTLHRLFHPAEWESLHETYGFSAEPPCSTFHLRLSKTSMWALSQGSRSLYQLDLTTQAGERIPDERFAELVPVLESFAVQLERAQRRGDTVSAERVLNNHLAQHRERDIRAEPETIPPPLEER